VGAASPRRRASSSSARLASLYASAGEEGGGVGWACHSNLTGACEQLVRWSEHTTGYNTPQQEGKLSPARACRAETSRSRACCWGAGSQASATHLCCLLAWARSAFLTEALAFTEARGPLASFFARCLSRALLPACLPGLCPCAKHPATPHVSFWMARGWFPAFCQAHVRQGGRSPYCVARGRWGRPCPSDCTRRADKVFVYDARASMQGVRKYSQGCWPRSALRPTRADRLLISTTRTRVPLISGCKLRCMYMYTPTHQAALTSVKQAAGERFRIYSVTVSPSNTCRKYQCSLVQPLGGMGCHAGV
jgi:hypothetical protein